MITMLLGLLMEQWRREKSYKVDSLRARAREGYPLHQTKRTPRARE